MTLISVDRQLPGAAAVQDQALPPQENRPGDRRAAAALPGTARSWRPAVWSAGSSASSGQRAGRQALGTGGSATRTPARSSSRARSTSCCSAAILTSVLIPLLVRRRKADAGRREEFSRSCSPSRWCRSASRHCSWWWRAPLITAIQTGSGLRAGHRSLVTDFAYSDPADDLLHGLSALIGASLNSRGQFARTDVGADPEQPRGDRHLRRLHGDLRPRRSSSPEHISPRRWLLGIGVHAARHGGAGDRADPGAAQGRFQLAVALVRLRARSADARSAGWPAGCSATSRPTRSPSSSWCGSLNAALAGEGSAQRAGLQQRVPADDDGARHRRRLGHDRSAAQDERGRRGRPVRRGRRRPEPRHPAHRHGPGPDRGGRTACSAPRSRSCCSQGGDFPHEAARPPAACWSWPRSRVLPLSISYLLHVRLLLTAGQPDRRTDQSARRGRAHRRVPRARRGARRIAVRGRDDGRATRSPIWSSALISLVVLRRRIGRLNLGSVAVALTKVARRRGGRRRTGSPGGAPAARCGGADRTRSGAAAARWPPAQ